MVAVSLSVSLFATQVSANTDDFDAYAASDGLTQDHADVFRLYWAFFDRKPEVDGAKHWVGEYDRCVSLLDITWAFGNSTEFVNKYGALSNRDYITLVYANVMGREPDDQGYEYWLGLLDGGTLNRSDMMLYFSLGQEFRRKRPLPSDVVASKPCTPPPAVTTTTAPPIDVYPDDVYYANCTEVREAGAAPLYRDDPGYRSGLDRDNDGIACEV